MRNISQRSVFLRNHFHTVVVDYVLKSIQLSPWNDSCEISRFVFKTEFHQQKCPWPNYYYPRSSLRMFWPFWWNKSILFSKDEVNALLADQQHRTQSTIKSMSRLFNSYPHHDSVLVKLKNYPTLLRLSNKESREHCSRQNQAFPALHQSCRTQTNRAYQALPSKT